MATVSPADGLFGAVSLTCMLQFTVWVCVQRYVSAYVHFMSPVADIRDELVSRKAVDVLCCVQAEHAANKVCLLPSHLLKIVIEATLQLNGSSLCTGCSHTSGSCRQPIDPSLGVQ